MRFQGFRGWCLGLCVSLLTACSSGGDGGGGGSGGGINPPTAERNFVTFETGQVRPLALSPDGNTLYVTNTPNSTLEI